MAEPVAARTDPTDPTVQMVRKRVETGEVSWDFFLQVALWRSQAVKVPDTSRVATQLYFEALETFKKGTKTDEVSMHPPIGGVHITTVGDLNLAFDGSKIRFDWSEAWHLIYEVEVLAEESKEWWPESGKHSAERRPHSLRAFGLVTWILGAIKQENGRHPADPGETLPKATEAFEGRMANYRAELEGAQQRLRAAMQRTAQSRYWNGALFGTAVLAGLCMVLGLVFLWQGVDAFYGVALPAGGLGAMVSLLQRMSSRKLVLDTSAGRDLLTVFGAVRPFIGAIFGLVVTALLLGGLIPAIEIPVGGKLGFFTGIGFIAGFNERWAQDMLKSSTSQVDALGPSGSLAVVETDA